MAGRISWIDSAQPHQTNALQTDPGHRVTDESCAINSSGQFIPEGNFLPNAIRVAVWGRQFQDDTATAALAVTGYDIAQKH
jgi:hypothetical protein